MINRKPRNRYISFELDREILKIQKGLTMITGKKISYAQASKTKALINEKNLDSDIQKIIKEII